MVRFYPVFAIFFSAICTLRGADPQRGKKEFEEVVLPALENYCYDCHGEGAAKGGLAFDHYRDYATMMTDAKVWEKVRLHLVNVTMPPPDDPQPTDQERHAMLSWVENQVFWVDPQHPDPGRVTLRRMNREEYNNTVRDVFGIRFKPAEDFPADDSGYGFDNIGDVLTISPLHLEKYLAAAERVVDTALEEKPPEFPKQRWNATKRDGFRFEGEVNPEEDGAAMFSAGAVRKKVTFPEPGKYRVGIRAAGSFAGNAWTVMKVSFGEFSREIEVNTKDFNPSDFTFDLEFNQFQEGDMVIEFTNDFWDEKTREDRNLKVFRLSIEGPVRDKKATQTDFAKWLFPRPAPESPNDRRVYAEDSLRRAGRLLWRRPVSVEELSGPMKVAADSLRQGDDFRTAVGYGLKAMMISPKFLYMNHGELGEGPYPGVKQLDEFALASRLSFFLWSSTPDDALIAAAEKGELRKNWKQHVGRMLLDPRSRALTSNFAGQWLQLRNLANASPDPELFPFFNANLAADMRRETEMMFEDLTKNNLSILLLLTADYSYVNKRLAKLYGLPEPPGEDFVKVSLKDSPRRGVLTHASVLTVTSDPNRTSPVKRGKWIMENLLGMPPSPAPANVPPLEVNGEVLAEGNLRERLEKHRSDPGCASCHATMDQYGFALENFDAVGRWRDKDGRHPVDSSGVLPNGTKWSGYPQFSSFLSAEMKDNYARRFVEAMLTYALGRGAEFYDKTVISEVLSKTRDQNYPLNGIILALTESPAFQLVRSVPQQQTAAAEPK